MRLVCPNCDAEYEVDDSAIPQEGRDVQCSACGHAWYQNHPEIEAAAEAEAELYEPPAGAVAPLSDEAPPARAAAPQRQTQPEPQPRPAPPRVQDDAKEEGGEPAAPTAAPTAATPPTAPQPPMRPRSLEETVLAVLREEAERETSARRAEVRPTLESQTEMTLPAATQAEAMSSAVRRIARLRGVEPEPAFAAISAPVPGPPAPVAQTLPAEADEPPRSRRNDFPAIEEINQTLRASGERTLDEADAVAHSLTDAEGRKGGFRRGFVLVVALGVLIVVLYTFAPAIAARVPALEGAAHAYVAGVDAGRVWLDGSLRGLVSWLRTFTQGQPG